MILYAFVGIHFLIVLLVYFLMARHVLDIDLPMLVLVIFIPVFGTLCAIIITIMQRMGKVGIKNDELELMRGGFKGTDELVIQTTETENAVPLEDALIMNDPSIRRSVMLDVLMSDAGNYMPVINQARMNDDVEVVHYATTAMVELSKEYELKLQEYSTAYAEDPTREGLIDEYIDFLGQYISSGMIQGQLLEIQRNTYQQLLTSKLILNPNMDDYEKLVLNFFASGQHIKADAALRTMEEYWPEDERNWLLRFRFYVETGAGSKVKEMIRTVKESGEYYSRKVRDVVDFWDRGEMEAGA